MKFRSSEITPERVYLSRRRILKGFGLVAGGAALAACAPAATYVPPAASDAAPTGPGATVPAAGPELPKAGATADEYGAALTPYDAVTGYNNFYEFTVDKQSVAALARGFVATPWTVAIGGLVNRPMTLDLGDLTKRFTQEERIYRMRCVEGWSMVIPWQGFSLADVLALVEPKSEAKFVRFESILRPEQMPGQRDRTYTWPYIEGLRIDEAMNRLTTLATGVYGKPLPNANGAPIRLVVPWKYGFKSIKSIVKIDLVADQPSSLWMKAAANEYGFYSNVNPNVPHPRWSQATERRINENGRRRTLMFNGYEAQVGGLYAGMDLTKNY